MKDKTKAFKKNKHGGYLGLLSNGEIPRTTDGKGKKVKEYVLWYGILDRCYNSKQIERHGTYERVEIAEEWKCYARFVEDLPTLENYDDWLNGGYDLNKDFYYSELQITTDVKVYSKETCRFVPHKQNLHEMYDRTGRKVKVIAINIETGERSRVFDNIHECARELGLTQNSVSRCVNGLQQFHKGYRFEKVD